MSVGVLGQQDTPTFTVGTGAPVAPPAAGDPILYIDDAGATLYAWDDGSATWLDVSGAGWGVAAIAVDVAGSDPALVAGASSLPIAFVGPDNGWTIWVDNSLLPPVAGTYAIIAVMLADAASAGSIDVRTFTTLGGAQERMAVDATSGAVTLTWVGEMDPDNGVGLLLDAITGPASINAQWSIHALRVA